MCKFLYIPFLVCLLLGTKEVFSQKDYFIIDNIIYTGKHKTKPRVIENEINFSPGDTIYSSALSKLLVENQYRILSTGLFNEAKINVVNWDTDKGFADIEISFQENWYLFPSIIFELADRNFNVWWKEQNRSLDRINYGLKLSHYNLTGSKDPLKIKVQFGFTRKFEIDYFNPYLSKNKRFGIGGSIFYADNVELPYITQGNRSLFGKNDDERILLRRFRVGGRVSNRPSVNSFHALRLEFHRNWVDNFVIEELNPNYFLDGRNSIKFFFAEYDYQFDKRKYTHYPQGGYLFFANIKKEGFGIFNEYDNLSISVGLEKYYELSNGLIVGTRNKAKTNLIRRQVAFANNTGLGWDSNIVSGYDLYVMDGTDYFITKNHIKKKLYEKNIKMADFLPTQFKYMNFQLFVRWNTDAAYVYEPIEEYLDGNTLNNRWIYGYGPAIDMILFNNFLFSFEYSFTDIGEHGFFIKNAIAF
jgi:outer membrane protein assembly factor BamA